MLKIRIFLPLLFIPFALLATAEIPQIRKELSSRLENRGDLIRKQVRRAGNRTIELQLYVSTELNVPLAQKVLADFPRYRDWALKNFNVHPTGEDYRFKVTDLRPIPDEPDQLGLQYALNIPLFSKKGEQVFDMAIKKVGDYVELTATSIKDTDRLVEKCAAKAFFFDKGPARTWVYIEAFLTVRSWLLYQAMPDALIEKIIGDRVEKLAENLLEATDALGAKPATAAGPGPASVRK